MDAQQAQREAANVTLVGMFFDLLLGVGKGQGGHCIGMTSNHSQPAHVNEIKHCGVARHRISRY